MSEIKQIGRVFAGVIGLTGLGMIIAEVIDSLRWVEFRLSPIIITVPMLIFYGLCEITIQRKKKEATSMRPPRAGSIFSWMNAVLSLIGLIFLLSIPLLWWGVIKRLAQSVSWGG